MGDWPGDRQGWEGTDEATFWGEGCQDNGNTRDWHTCLRGLSEGAAGWRKEAEGRRPPAQLRWPYEVCRGQHRYQGAALGMGLES